jgi:HEXXH motif-containing protein
LALIQLGSPVYMNWIARLTRTLIGLRISHGSQNSTTSFLAPSVIAMGTQNDPVLTAETLVHEATHQYLYAISRLGRLETGTDVTLYYSPFKKTGRPLFYIILTYHAFGNVLLFYRALRNNGVLLPQSRQDVDLRVADLEKDLKVLENALRGSRALTEIGKDLWEPVCAQIHASR